MRTSHLRAVAPATPNSLNGKPPPMDTALERRVLASAIHGSWGYCKSHWTADLFHSEQHRAIAAIVEEIGTKGRVTKLSVVGSLPHELRDQVQDMASARLTQPELVDAMVRLRELSDVRRVMSECWTILAEGYAERSPDWRQWLGGVPGRMKIAGGEAPVELVSLDVDMKATWKELYDQWTNKENLPCMPSGFPSFDKLVGGGLFRGRVNFLTAETGGGKTAFATCLAYESRLRTLICSYEMTRSELHKRLTASRAEVSITNLMTGETTSREQQYVADYINLRDIPPIAIRYMPDTGVNEIEASIDEAAALFGGIDLVAVDYHQLLNPLPGMERADERKQLSANVKALKRVANEKQVCIILISQVNDDGKIFGGRESGFTCDAWVHIERTEESYRDGTQMHLTSKKARWTEKNPEATMLYRGRYMRWEEIACLQPKP